MKKEKTNKYEKGIILVGIVVVLILLILITADGIKNMGKNNMPVALLEQEEIITNTPNAPTMSAGMIPVKYEGDNLIITKNDNSWYNYEEGNPAYMMLNDGVYQSELVVDMTGKKLASENIGEPVTAEEQGSIYMWIPRYAYKENGETRYIKEETQPGGEWIVPDMFSYMVADETKPNYSLAGIWVEKTPLDNITKVNTKIANMAGENNLYGFIANTVGVNARYCSWWFPYLKEQSTSATEDSETQNDTYNVGAHICALDDWENENRPILKIIDTGKHEPIKANIIHNTVDKKIEIRVTYNKNGIREVVDEYENKLNQRIENGIVIADTGEEVLVNGKYAFTIIDNKGNKKELSIGISVGNIYTATFTSMNNTSAYNKTKETVTSNERTLLQEIQETDASMTYVRAEEDKNGDIVAIGKRERTEEDLQMYLYNIYLLDSKTIYVLGSWNSSTSGKTFSSGYAYTSYTVNETTGAVRLSGKTKVTAGTEGTYYNMGNSFYDYGSTGTSSSTVYELRAYSNKTYTALSRHVTTSTSYVKSATLDETEVAEDGTYPNNGECNYHNYRRWSVKTSTIVPRYKLVKLDSNRNIIWTYDVDNKTYYSAPIDVKSPKYGYIGMTITATVNRYDFKVYISDDSSTWQEVTDVYSNQIKRLDIGEWNKLYIKIEANTSSIGSINLKYCQD